MKTDTQGLITRYLKELEHELVALPRSRRRRSWTMSEPTSPRHAPRAAMTKWL